MALAVEQFTAPGKFYIDSFFEEMNRLYIPDNRTLTEKCKIKNSYKIRNKFIGLENNHKKDITKDL